MKLNKILKYIFIIGCILIITILLYNILSDNTHKSKNDSMHKSMHKSMHTSNFFTGNILDIVVRLNKKYNTIDENNDDENKKRNDIVIELKNFISNYIYIYFNINFCKSVKNNSIIVPPTTKESQKGGTAGSIGLLYRKFKNKKYEIMVLDNQHFSKNGLAMSFSPSSKHIIIKKTIPVDKKRILKDCYSTETGYNLPDPFFEVFCNSILNIFYSSGQLPHVTKIYGFYGCSLNENSNEYYLVYEKNSMTLVEWMKKSDGSQKDTKKLIEYVFQVFYTISQLKKYIKFRHFDLHCNNIMIQNIDNLLYQGLTCDYNSTITYIINNKKITIDTNGFISKIIDIGMSSIFLNDIEFRFINKNAKQMIEAYNFSNPNDPNSSGFYQVDNIFFILNLSHNICNMSQWKNNIILKNFIKECTSDLILPEKLFSSQWPELDNTFKQSNGEHLYGKSIWEVIEKWYFSNNCLQLYNKIFGNTFINLRGLFGLNKFDLKDIEINNLYFVNKCIPFLNYDLITNINQIKNSLTNNIVLFYNFDEAELNKKINIMPNDKFILNYINKCINKPNNEECNTPNLNYKLFIEKNQKNLIQHSLVASEFANKKINGFNIYKSQDSSKIGPNIQYNYYNLNTPTIAKNYKWFDQSVYLKETIFDDTAINLHIFNIKNPYTLDINIGNSLYTTGLKTLRNLNKNEDKNFIVINGNYFIVKPNIDDKLCSNINNAKCSLDKLYNPIGYFYANPNIFENIDLNENGILTEIEIPLDYHSNFGAITYNHLKNQWSLEKYDSFLNKHITKEIIQYKQYINTNEIVPVKSKTIIQPNSQQYDLAFVSGPIFIFNHKPVFDINEKFIDNMGEFKVTSYAKDNYKFISLSNDDNIMPYGQRHSNYIVNQNIMLFMDDGSISFIIIEGRGYDSLGLQRSQVLEILKTIPNIKHAISLDGGFSANAVIHDAENQNIYDSKLKFAVNDPEKRKLGLSLIFINE